MITLHSLDVAARTVAGEARGSTFQDRVAVANVIFNRAALPSWWGDTVESVCLKPFQFSCWNKGDPNSQIIAELEEDDPVYLDALGIVALVAAARCGRKGTPYQDDPTAGSTHYATLGLMDKAPPNWANGLQPVVRIGAHAFFNDPSLKPKTVSIPHKGKVSSQWPL